MIETLLLQLRDARKHSVAFESASRSWSFGGFLADVRKAAHALESLRDSGCSTVGIKCKNYYQHWVLIFALERLGLASASFQNDFGPSFQTYLNVIKPDFFLSDEPLITDLKHYVVDDAWFKQVLNQENNNSVSYESRDFCRIGVAAGTGSEPQKIGLRRSDIERNISQIINSDILSLSEKARREHFNVLCCIGIDILAGYQIVLSALAAGCCIKIFDPVQISLIIARHEPTAIVVSPLHLEYVINSISPLSIAQDNLEIIVVGGRLPEELEKKTREKLSKKIYTLYGTEEAGIISVKKLDHHSEHKNAGVIVPWMDVQIVDGQNVALPVQTEGRVRVRGNTVIDGYIGNVENKNSQFQEGWFYPGDLGFITNKKEIFITGRIDELVTFGGDKFDLRILDRICKNFDNIEDGCVFSVPDENGILMPWVAIICHTEIDGSALSRRMHERYQNLPPITLIWVDRIPYRDDGSPNRQFLTQGIMNSR
ncbi:hypothetical protein AD948_03115 [Acetobacter senegalensis]|uniref:AMP-dependent synthetase/ligase domain-containing protein n=1 Tax=Acetobacter senegalensis TaxID=446692 RepID=A0A149U6B7_9PROT|nr:class I adenylate-forming enzyme family protein [Acetobacter senegalensis]KXV61034.1 hypothetical protein AD948_03115 [Acetobacter senegalensis]